MNENTTVKQAQQRLTEVQAQLYVNIKQREGLEDEAKSLAAFLNLTQREEQEQRKRKADEEAKELDQT